MNLDKMSGTPNENDLGSYLTRTIDPDGNYQNGRAEIWGHKSKAVIRGAGLFHEIAQYHGINRLSTRGGYSFNEEIPEATCPQGSWTFVLDEESRETFENKYLRRYQAN